MTVESNSDDKFKPLYKAQRRLPRAHLNTQVLDASNYQEYTGPYSIQSSQFAIDPAPMETFLGSTTSSNTNPDHPIMTSSVTNSITIDQLPGLKIIPQLFPDQVQKKMLADTIEHYIPDEKHISNLNLHYDIPRPFDIFDDQSHPKIMHKEPNKPGTTMRQIRNKQLRWITLGGQYDWTAKKYPTFQRGAEGWPDFPSPLADLLASYFPPITPEAAIINFYSPGDILSPHQDVAELSKADLVSVSIGCECIFYCGVSRDTEPLQLLLKSGDVIVMGGKSRNAFHGVGRVFENTCPDYLLTDWNPKYSEWVASKRVNLNVRQMLNNDELSS